MVSLESSVSVLEPWIRCFPSLRHLFCGMSPTLNSVDETILGCFVRQRHGLCTIIQESTALRLKKASY